MSIRRPDFVAPARCLCLLAAPALCLAPVGCTSKPKPTVPAAKTTASAPAANPKPAAQITKAPTPATTPLVAARNPQSTTPTLLPPALRPVGRVVAVDEKARTAIVEFHRFAALPDTLTEVTLFARDRELRPVARLAGTSYQQGLILGVKITEGRAAVGDEVVLPAPSPPAPTTPPAAFPALQPAPTK